MWAKPLAALDDVMKLGPQPVPLHLRSAGDRRLKAHGIGVGYMNPHEFEGDDVDQQYLPDALKERRYYFPTEEGPEAGLKARMEARAASRADGRPRRKKPEGPQVDGMRASGDALKKRAENLRAIADTEKKDAGS